MTTGCSLRPKVTLFHLKIKNFKKRNRRKKRVKGTFKVSGKLLYLLDYRLEGNQEQGYEEFGRFC